MLERVRYTQASLGDLDETPKALSAADIGQFLRRYLWLIAACALTGAIAMFAYAMVTPATFVARAQILIDSRLPQALREQLGEAGAALDSPAIESQIALLRSGKLMSDVVEKLGLDVDSEFGTGRPREPSLWRRLLGRVPPPEGPNNSDNKRDITISNLQDHIDIRRYGLSYVLDVSASSRDPEKAAKIVNALTDAFTADQLNLKIDAAKQASDWREEQIGRLRQQMNSAARAVQEYKARRDYRLPPRLDDSRPAAAPAGDTAKEPAVGTREAVTLEELDVAAQAYRKIYEMNLQAHADAVLRQTLQFTNARVITSATPSRTPMHPKTRLLTLVGLLVGAIAGLGSGLLHYALDARLRTGREIGSVTASPPLASLPAVRRLVLPSALEVHMPGRDARELEKIVSWTQMPEVTSQAGDVVVKIRRMRKPGSGFALGLVNVSGRNQSALVALAIAVNARKLGEQVIVVDCQCDQPEATSSVLQKQSPPEAEGLASVIAGNTSLHDAIVTCPSFPDIALLPGGMDASGSSIAQITAPSLQAVKTELTQTYGLAVLVLPDLMQHRALAVEIASAPDAIVVAIEAGTTTAQQLRNAMEALSAAGIEPLGVILYGSHDAQA